MPRLAFLPLLAAGALLGCDSDVSDAGGNLATTNTAASGTSASTSSGGDVVELTPNAPPLPGQTECKVTIRTNIPIAGAKHEAVCTPLTYGTNPPTSGNHWGSWASFKKYASEVPREMLVHNLEHGAIVMTYDCDGACATEVVAAFDAASAAIGGDTLCTLQTQGTVQNRVIIAPDAALDAPIALAAWGASYVATCIDAPSLEAFAKDHYAKGPENICADGKDPATICPPM